MTAWSSDSMTPQVVFTVAHAARNADFANQRDDGPPAAGQARQGAGQKIQQTPQETSGRATYAAVPFANGWLFVKI